VSVTTNGRPVQPLKRPRPVNPTLQRLVDRYWPSKVARELRKRSKPGWRALPDNRGEWTLVFYGDATQAHRAVGALERARDGGLTKDDNVPLNLLRSACIRAELARVADYNAAER
jgi:hypothetical protein